MTSGSRLMSGLEAARRRAEGGGTSSRADARRMRTAASASLRGISCSCSIARANDEWHEYKVEMEFLHSRACCSMASQCYVVASHVILPCAEVQSYNAHFQLTYHDSSTR